MSKSYEIKKINGEDVFVAKINDDFWLFNDVLVCFGTKWVYNDRDVVIFLNNKISKLHPYEGISSGKFLFMKQYGENFIRSEFYMDGNISEDNLGEVLLLYDEYRNWSGNSGE